jgi:hypothetical protein
VLEITYGLYDTLEKALLLFKIYQSPSEWRYPKANHNILLIKHVIKCVYLSTTLLLTGANFFQYSRGRDLVELLIEYIKLDQKIAIKLTI